MILSGLRRDWWPCAEASQAGHCFWGSSDGIIVRRIEKPHSIHHLHTEHPWVRNSTLDSLAHLGTKRPQAGPAKTNRCCENLLKGSALSSVTNEPALYAMLSISLCLTVTRHIHLYLSQGSLVLFLGVCLTYRHTRLDARAPTICHGFC